MKTLSTINYCLKNKNNMKKNLAMQLRDRYDSINYRTIKASLMKKAGDKDVKQQLNLLPSQITPETIVRLENEGITIEKNSDHGFDMFVLTWAVSKEQRLAEQIKWSVDFNEKHISVPEKELAEAESNCIVAEMKGLGFYIQSAIA